MFTEAGLVYHPNRADALSAAKEAETFLKEKGVRVVCCGLSAENTGAGFETDGDKLILTFGGDGTLLAGAGLALHENCPLLGFNLGTVGFLTAEEPGELQNALDAVLQGKYIEEERSLLLIRNEQTGASFYALNDAVVTRGGYARLIRVETTINGELHDCCTADGLIVATPTGSTGYSLSAGGPVVEPSMNCMIITPVCAHSLTHCPTVVSDQSVIRLQLRRDREQTAELQIDGQNRGSLRGGDAVTICGTERKMRLIRLHPYPFFRLMRQKLTEWGSNHE